MMMMMILCFTYFSILFQSGRDDGWVNTNITSIDGGDDDDDDSDD